MATIREWCQLCHETAKLKGWYDQDRTVPELLCLVHSEVSEALEAWRESGLYCSEGRDGKLNGFGSELADIAIRLFDIAEFFGIDLEAEIEAKYRYNQSRSYRHGGKLA